MTRNIIQMFFKEDISNLIFTQDIYSPFFLHLHFLFALSLLEFPLKMLVLVIFRNVVEHANCPLTIDRQ